MHTNAYENALRGHQTMQPMRNDALRGFGGSIAFFGPATVLAVGLGGIILKDIIQGERNNLKVPFAGMFLLGWLLGGAAISA